MKRANVVAVFAAGWTSAIACLWIAGGIRAQAAVDDAIHVCIPANGVLRFVSASAICPPGQQTLALKRWKPDTVDVPDLKKTPLPSSIDPRRVDELERQIKALEDAAGNGSLSNRVVAPFEVVDRSGKRIFYVEPGFVRVYNAAGAEVATVQALEGGGVFTAKSSTGGLVTTVGDGFRVIDNKTARIAIGRPTPPDGSYTAQFFAPSGKRVASLGQTRAGNGAATVGDDQGNLRALMAVNQDGKGALGVYNADSRFVAHLDEGDTGGGLLTLTSADGTPMVIAETNEGGFGVVRAGPESFKPGLGLLGLPGSYIAGKPK